jgi:hypothetical protein
MTLSSKRELIQAIRKVYRRSTKAQKSSHLDHLELATGLKRNYLNRLLLQGYKAKRRKPGRKSRYASDPEFMEAYKRLRQKRDASLKTMDYTPSAVIWRPLNSAMSHIYFEPYRLRHLFD